LPRPAPKKVAMVQAQRVFFRFDSIAGSCWIPLASVLVLLQGRLKYEDTELRHNPVFKTFVMWHDFTGGVL